MRIDDIDPDDVPDEPRPFRPPDGPSPPDSPPTPDTAPAPLLDPAERCRIRRAYQDLVAAVHADYPNGTSDTSERPATSDSAANGRDDCEQTVIPVTPQTEVADPSRRVASLERMYKGDESLYCPVAELKGDEPGTAQRLMDSREFTGDTLKGFKDPTGNPDYIDEYKRTYDAIGGPSAWAAPELDMNGMISQIKRHLYRKVGVDFTVLDLTGASSHQIDQVFESLDVWRADTAMRPLSKLIILGDDF